MSWIDNIAFICSFISDCESPAARKAFKVSVSMIGDMPTGIDADAGDTA
jgi:hypothetical protein